MTILNYKVFSANATNEEISSQTPLIILHGLLGAMDNWRTQAKRLAESRTVYTFDLRNHGGSPHVKGMSYREMYEDVIQTAQELELDSFHLLGHSMGGKVAMQLSLAQPELIKNLVVVDIAPKPYPLWHQKTLQGVMSAPVQSMTSRKEIDEFLKPWIDDPSERSFMLKNLKRMGKNFEWRCNLEEISKGYLKIAGFSTAIDTFKKNTLFIKGGNSNYITEADTSLIQTLFSCSKIVTLDKSGHLPHLQEADSFYELVNNFFATQSLPKGLLTR